MRYREKMYRRDLKDTKKAMRASVKGNKGMVEADGRRCPLDAIAWRLRHAKDHIIIANTL